jgi:AcrR family transcriptional regulator
MAAKSQRYDTVQYTDAAQKDTYMSTVANIKDQHDVDDADVVPSHGRALDARRDVAIREATLDLLAEIGYDRLTMDAVAARAHASKATIYRRWQGKASLVVDALNCSKGQMVDPDTGSLVGDLDKLSEGFASQESDFNAKVMIGLITALAHDAELRDVVREMMIEPRTRMIRTLFERAIMRGEVPKDRNLDLLVALFPALMIHQILITGELPDADFARHVMSDVILPLATASK